jgi:hypothetical protein
MVCYFTFFFYCDRWSLTLFYIRKWLQLCKVWKITDTLWTLAF